MKSQRFSCFLLLFLYATLLRAETFRVATYNVENYLDQPTESRPHVKSPSARAKICESIVALHPDVIALQEMGAMSALMELRASLKKRGQDFPYCELVSASDTNIHIAVLSRFPFSANRAHTKDTFLLGGRRFRVGRGFAELDIRVNPGYTFTLLAAHLKSRRPVPEADQAELRIEEAMMLRRIVDADLAAKPDAKLIVLGDLNDTKDSPSTKLLIGKGRTKLFDARPAERNGDDAPSTNPAWQPRNVTWTHYYGAEDTYSRIDYILMSPAMSREWVKEETYVLEIPNWGTGSDHRPLVATFSAE